MFAAACLFDKHTQSPSFDNTSEGAFYYLNLSARFTFFCCGNRASQHFYCPQNQYTNARGKQQTNNPDLFICFVFLPNEGKNKYGLLCVYVVTVNTKRFDGDYKNESKNMHVHWMRCGCKT